MANDIQTVKSDPTVAPSMGVTAGFSSAEGFELLQRMAHMFNTSTLVPQEFRGADKFGNCVIALNMAQRLNADPLMVMQNLYIVYGNPAWSSKFLIAMFNQCGRYESIHYRETGKKGTDSQGVVAWAKEKSTGEVIEGPEVTIGVAKAEGWFTKNGSKWKTMPDQMLRYRAAAWFIRTTAPELSMGLQTRDEAEDVGPRNITDEVDAARKEISRKANAEVFVPKKPAPAIQPGVKLTQEEIEARTVPAEPVKEAAPAKAKKAEPAQVQEEIEGPGF